MPQFQATTFWLQRDRLSGDELQRAFAPFHEAFNLAAWQRKGLTLVRVGGLVDPSEVLSGLARQLGVRTWGLLGEAGQSDHFVALAFSPRGELTWQLESPERASAESKAIGKKAGVTFLSWSKISDAEDRGREPEGVPLAHVPYWKVHLEAGLTGSQESMALYGAPELLQPEGTPFWEWKSAQSERETARRKQEVADGLAAVTSSLTKVLRRLEKKLGGPLVALAFSGSSAGFSGSGVLATTAKAVEHERRRLIKRSALMRASPALQARCIEAREAWQEVPLPPALARAVSSGDSRLALVEWLRQQLGAGLAVGWYDENQRSPFTWFDRELPAPAFSRDEWKKVPARELVAAIAECERVSSVLFDPATPSLRAWLESDPKTFAPLVAEALLAAGSEPGRALEHCGWVLTAPGVKSLAKNRAFVATVERLAAQSGLSRYADALKRLGR